METAPLQFSERTPHPAVPEMVFRDATLLTEVLHLSCEACQFHARPVATASCRHARSEALQAFVVLATKRAECFPLVFLWMPQQSPEVAENHSRGKAAVRVHWKWVVHVQMVVPLSRVACQLARQEVLRLLAMAHRQGVLHQKHRAVASQQMVFSDVASLVSALWVQVSALHRESCQGSARHYVATARHRHR